MARATREAAGVRSGTRGLVVALLMFSVVALASDVAHAVDPAQILASLGTAEVQKYFDIQAVGRDSEVPSVVLNIINS